MNELADDEWWVETLAGQNDTSATVDKQMPRIMENFDRAMHGDGFARAAIFNALHLIQRSAKARIRDQEKATA